MLDALEGGVKGGKWFSLIDKVWSTRTLTASYERVRRNGGAAGVDQQSIAAFEARSEVYLAELSSALQEGRYVPQPVRRTWIPKPGTKKMRPLGIPTIKDRIVQGALRLVLEPIFERDFSDSSYGFRPQRGCKDALRRVDALLKDGYVWVVDADIQSYFDNIDHDLLMEEVAAKVSDGPVLSLIGQLLRQPVMEGLDQWTPVKGSPQGAVLSPLLANIFLHPIDVALDSAGIHFARYADDLVLLCKTESEAQQAYALLQSLMRDRKLDLHPEKTKIVDARQPGGFDFLGYHFERGYRHPRDKSVKALKSKVRKMTPRHPGTSLEAVIVRLNRVTQGWFEYFKHSHRAWLLPLDKWIRMRLRTIMRHYEGRSGRGDGLDHYKWPNAYFIDRGLFTFQGALDRQLRSRCGNS
jgi:RNA-directed DNA polymerase